MGDDLVAEMQALQIRINGSVTLALMERVQARGNVVVKGRAMPLVYPWVMVHLEARTEMPAGGYVQQVSRTTSEYRAMTVLTRDDLPLFAEARAYAQERIGDERMGDHCDRRLQLTPLDMNASALAERARRPGIVLDSRQAPTSNVVLLAQGELATPLRLEKLRDFFVTAVTITGARVNLGPFRDKDIMRKFNADCAERRRWFRDGGTIDQTRLTAPHQVDMASVDGARVTIRLVRHEGKVCLLGVAFSITVDATELPPSVECAVCLEECDASEWSCPCCRNLLHHVCRDALPGRLCPYCRFEE